MPIDPAALRAQAAAAAAAWSDPAACAAAFRRLLEAYADRVHRYSPRLAETAPPHELKTPAPVRRAALAALRGPASAAPHEALALARALWAGGTVEERQLAAEVLGLAAAQAPAEAAAQVEAWLPEIDSGATAEALVKFGLSPMLAADPYAGLERARRWLTHPRRWIRRCGLAVIITLAHERQWDDVPAAVEVLRTVMGERDPGVRSVVSAALRALAPRDPPAVVRFLREHAGRQDHNTQVILRAVLRDLPAEAQTELTR
nr:DNA alkylation repair protein [Anaerolineales bacterium]